MTTAVNGLGLAGTVVPTSGTFNPATAVGQGFSQAVTIANGPSGTIPIAGLFTALGPSTTFAPIAGRPFNVSVSFAGANVIQLQRSFDSGVSWFTTDTLSASDSSAYQEPEYGVLYRLNCTAYASNIVYRMSQ